MTLRFLLFISTTSFFLIADQLTKLYVNTSVSLVSGSRIQFLFFDLVFVKNPSVVLGSVEYSSSPGKFIAYFGPAFILSFFAWLIFKGHTNRFGVISGGLICGGVLGNFFDRIRFGYTIDILSFSIKEFSFSLPSFNLADLCFHIGLLMLIVHFYLQHREYNKNAIQTAP